MAGYSGTPLPKKLGIKEHTRVALLDVPEQIKSELKEPLASCQIVTPNHAPLDLVLVFVKSQAELQRQCSRLLASVISGRDVMGVLAEEDLGPA